MTEQLSAMPRYEVYKDSGVDWLGEIPEHWEVRKLKFLASIKTGERNTEDKKENGLYPFFVRSQTPEKINSYSYDGEAILTAGDGAGVGKVYHYINGKFDYHQRVYKFSNFKEVIGQYLYRYLTINFSNVAMLGTAKSTVDSLRLPLIQDFIVCFPKEKGEQTAIAAFLDRKTAQIDQAVEIKKQKVVLLKERKQILIQNAVTRGLNPDAPMRDSGVAWIGKIPAHWNIVANRSIFKERVEPGQDELPLLSVSIHSGVSTGELHEDDNIRGRVKIEDKTKYNLVKPDDIVFNMMRAWQGAIGAVKVKGMVSPAYIIARPKGSIKSQYFEYQYRCPIFIQQMDRFSKGITDFRKRLYWHEFKQLVTLLPPTAEQNTIVAHIKTQSAKIDKAIDLQEQQINKLKEYKATLINSAVTGKIKVPMPGEAKAMA